MSYHLFGALSTLFYLLSLTGMLLQLRLIQRRKVQDTISTTAGFATNILSLNQFTVGFLAYYAFFVYGFSIEPFNHYLVWPRLVAILLTLWILYEIFSDRKSRSSSIALFSCVFLTLLGLIALCLGTPLLMQSRLVSQLLAVGVSVLLAQGYLHQILMIRKYGQTGAVSKQMHQFILLKDIFTVIFGFVMGLTDGWPLILLCGTSLLTKIAILWQFRWARISPVALSRRDLTQP